MITINEILRDNFDKFEENNIISPHVKKVIQSIIDCRTEKMGQRIIRCSECGYEEISFCSCRNRHCPLCQMFVKEKWVAKKKSEVINTTYYHLVFTMPKELEIIIKMHEKIMYNLMFKCVSETLLELALDKKYLGCQTGALLILHTWSQNLSYHPHIHLLVPGGGLDCSNKWVEVEDHYFIPVKVLSSKFKNKFMYYFDKLVKTNSIKFPRSLEYLHNDLHLYNYKESLKKKDWYVYIKEAFSGPAQVIEYFGRYTHRVAISNNRIKKVEDGVVTFTYRDRKDDNKLKEMALNVNEFIRRYILHILPAKFMKIRYIGILSNRNKSTKLFICQIATKAIDNKKLFIEFTTVDLLIKITKGKIFKCPSCNGNSMFLVGINVKGRGDSS